MDNTQKSMEKIVALCKGRGYVFAGSEIYGGLANTWDYGPLGAELKNNVKKAWWKRFVQENPHNVGLDSAILMNPQVWVASGHVGGFSDPLMDCKSCKTRHRADNLIEEQTGAVVTGWSNEQMRDFIREKGVKCPGCSGSDFTDIRQFNLMFKTFQGVTEDAKNEVYLRPETAQGIFVNFANVQRASRKKIPFGIAQLGKSFRNEITPGNFIFRTREFEQMEIEFFCKPGTNAEWFAWWKEACGGFLADLGIKQQSLRTRDHDKEELSFYSEATTDFEFLFPFGWGELWGLADRTDFDLSAHMKASGKSLEYFDQEANEHYLPYVIEPSLGVERTLLALICDAYDEEELGEGDTRTVMRLNPALAPIKAAVLPLSKKLGEGAKKLQKALSKRFMTDYDDSGAIGRRYRRQDEIGTPFCVTYDFQSEEDGRVTVRDRDTMAQERIPIDELGDYIAQRIEF
ncbi:MAG: glycine--tRNA ligase [Oscillospiraceae bacterium]|nr:glycine--tRNA ligase [Oscillospiraceae bacterium]